jgi:hypothetical protein
MFDWISRWYIVAFIQFDPNQTSAQLLLDCCQFGRRPRWRLLHLQLDPRMQIAAFGATAKVGNPPSANLKLGTNRLGLESTQMYGPAAVRK